MFACSLELSTILLLEFPSIAALSIICLYLEVVSLGLELRINSPDLELLILLLGYGSHHRGAHG